MSEEKAKITTPDMELAGMVKDLTKGDDLSDLTELEILAISAYSAVNSRICPLPFFTEFKKEYIRLRKSKGRMSRMELVEILKKRPNYYHTHNDEEIFDTQVKKPGWLSKVFKRGK